MNAKNEAQEYERSMSKTERKQNHQSEGSTPKRPLLLIPSRPFPTLVMSKNSLKGILRLKPAPAPSDDKPPCERVPDLPLFMLCRCRDNRGTTPTLTAAPPLLGDVVVEGGG